MENLRQDVYEYNTYLHIGNYTHKLISSEIGGSLTQFNRYIVNGLNSILIKEVVIPLMIWEKLDIKQYPISAGVIYTYHTRRYNNPTPEFLAILNEFETLLSKLLEGKLSWDEFQRRALSQKPFGLSYIEELFNPKKLTPVAPVVEFEIAINRFKATNRRLLHYRRNLKKDILRFASEYSTLPPTEWKNLYDKKIFNVRFFKQFNAEVSFDNFQLTNQQVNAHEVGGIADLDKQIRITLNGSIPFVEAN